MVRNYQKFSDGAAPIATMTKDFLAIVNQLVGLVDDKLLANFTKTQFLVSGYDFASGEPFLKKIYFDAALGRYQRHPGGGLKVGNINAAVSFIGDEYEDYFNILARRLRSAGTEVNFQPVEALLEVVSKQGRHSSVGGSLQVVKVYRHRNYLPYAIRANGEAQISLFGRPLLEYEKTQYPILEINDGASSNVIEYADGNQAREQKGPAQL